MTTALTILAALGRLLQPAIPWLVCFALGVYVGHGGCRHVSERPTRSASFAVRDVPVGNRIEVAAGVLDRRTRAVVLAGIACPVAGEPFANQAKTNLAKLAGATIRVETNGRAPVRGELLGTAWGETGVCLNLAQVKAGLAWCDKTAPKEWQAAEKDARTAKRGIWKGRGLGTGGSGLGTRGSELKTDN